MYHHMRDHHGAIEGSMFAPTLFDGCVCGDATNSSLHSAPPCDWCDDGNELGTPAPWWSRMWCRLCAWLFVAK